MQSLPLPCGLKACIAADLCWSTDTQYRWFMHLSQILPHFVFFLLAFSSSFPIPPNWCTFAPILFAVFMHHILLLVTVVKIWCCWFDTNLAGQKCSPGSWAGLFGLLSPCRPLDGCYCPCSSTDFGAVGRVAHSMTPWSQITQLKSACSVTPADLGAAVTSRGRWQWAASTVTSYPTGATTANLAMAYTAVCLLSTFIVVNSFPSVFKKKSSEHVSLSFSFSSEFTEMRLMREK